MSTLTLPENETQEIVLAALRVDAGRPIAWASKATLGRMRNLGLITVAPGQVELTEDGLLVANLVHAHQLSTGRRQRGRGVIAGSGMTYGTTGSCSCGWKDQSSQSPSSGGESVIRTRHTRHLAGLLNNQR